MSITTAIKLPTRKFRSVLHYGDLSRAVSPRFGSSYEGPCLSCAEDEEVADAWHAIARLGGYALWVLEVEAGFRCLNIHRLAASSRRALLAQAEDEGLIEPCPLWRVTWPDEEDGERYSDFSDKAKATQEVEFTEEDEDGAKMEEIAGWRALDPLLAFWRTNHPEATISPSAVDEVAIMFLIERDHPEVDGIYWADILDPDSLSAPRIGLFQRTVLRAEKTMIAGPR